MRWCCLRPLVGVWARHECHPEDQTILDIWSNHCIFAPSRVDVAGKYCVFDPWHSCWTTSKLKDCLEFALMPQNSESTGIICLRVGLCICFLARRWRDWGSLGEFWNKDECAFLHFVPILTTFLTIFEIVQLCDRTELRKILEFCWIVYIIGFEPNTMRYNNIATVCEKMF